MLVVGSNVCEFPGPSLYSYVISTRKVKFEGSGGTCLVETACTCRRCVRKLYLFGEVIFLHGCRYCMRDRVRDSMLWYSNKLSAHGIFQAIWLRTTSEGMGPHVRYFFQPPPIPRCQLHNLHLQPLLGRIPSYWL